jgi:hypothetical protein
MITNDYEEAITLIPGSTHQGSSRFSHNSEPDVFIKQNGKSPENGKPIVAKVYKGTGRHNKNSIYAKNAKGPIFGEAEYLALQKSDAHVYGPDIIEVEIRLENPYIINGPSDIRNFADGVQIPPDNVSRNEYFLNVRAKLEAAGHDGVVVNVAWNSDVGLMGERSKQLAETFGITQIIKFRKEPNKQIHT